MMPKLRPFSTCLVTMLLLQIIPILVPSADGINMEDELRVTWEQKAAIDKLRQLILPYVTEDYMKEELHLVRWLRATNFDVDRARIRMMENITWRKNHKVATIHQEYFSDLEDELPYVVTLDKQGQPIYIAYAGEWDVRGVIVTGRTDRALRYVTRILELGSRRVREMQHEGKNVSRLSLILDLSGFNLAQHTCARCLLRIVDFVRIYSTYYTGMADKLITINTPPTITTALEMVKQNLDPETRKIIKLYGWDRNEWERVLLAIIDRDKLPERLGGTLI